MTKILEDEVKRYLYDVGFVEDQYIILENVYINNFPSYINTLA